MLSFREADIFDRMDENDKHSPFWEELRNEKHVQIRYIKRLKIILDDEMSFSALQPEEMDMRLNHNYIPPEIRSDVINLWNKFIAEKRSKLLSAKLIVEWIVTHYSGVPVGYLKHEAEWGGINVGDILLSTCVFDYMPNRGTRIRVRSMEKAFNNGETMISFMVDGNIHTESIKCFEKE